MKIRPLVATAASILMLSLLGACGSSDDASDGGSTGDQASTTTSSGGAATSPTAVPSVTQAQMDEVQSCLDAAGVDVDIPSGVPSDLPSDVPTDIPSEFASGGPFADPEVQAALKACGIDAPTAPAQP